MTDDAQDLRERLVLLEAEAALLRERLAAPEHGGAPSANALNAAPAEGTEARLLAILGGTADLAIVTTDPARRITSWSEGARTLFGWRDREVLGRSLELLFMVEDHAGEALQARLAALEADGRFAAEHWLRRQDGSSFFGSELLLPLMHGPDSGWVAIFRDRTQEHRTELAWRRGEEQLRLILESAIEYAIFTMDRDGRVTTWNSGAERLLGYTEEEIIGRDARIIFTPEDCAAKAPEQEMEGALAHGRAMNERWHVRQDGSRFWGSGMMMPLKVGDSQPGLLKIMRDQTERRRHEELQRLLIGELNHRIKNTLTTVQTLADQTLRGSTSLEAFATAFRSRLQALAQAHDLLTRVAWQEVALADVVAAALDGWAPADRVTIAGPEVRVNPKQALALTLSLHELATNAMKHGSLSGMAGRVTLGWSVGETCRITWRESGGPAVAAPERHGFGSRVLGGALAVELAGSVDLDYRPEGLVCKIAFTPKQDGPLSRWPLDD